MKLRRISTNPMSDRTESKQDFQLQDETACLDFYFGGSERMAHFLAAIDWSDVEALIRVFASANHPEAARLVQARKVASAIADLMRISN
jgi:hypothetical protein